MRAVCCTPLQYTEKDDARNMLRFEYEELKRARLEKEMILQEKRRKTMADLEPSVTAVVGR